MKIYLLKHYSIMNGGANIELCLFKSELDILELYIAYKKAGKDVLDPYSFIKYSETYNSIKIIPRSSSTYTNAYNKSNAIQYEDIN